MKAIVRKTTFLLLLLAFLFPETGCVLTAPYDQYVYAQSTSLKVDALKLMNKAVRPYESEKESVLKFTDQWDKLFEYELHRKNNDIRIEMWKLLRDPGKHLLGGFLKRWEDRQSLSPDFITEAKTQVAKAFDELSELESGKITPKELKK